MPTKIFFVLGMLVFAACSGTEPPVAGPPTTVLRVGLIPERDIFRQLDRYEPLAGYISEKVGVQVELKVLRRYGNIVDNFLAGEMDAAFFGSFTYVLAHEKLGVKVLARPEALDGSSTYHGLLIVRSDSGIHDCEGMAGKIFAFVDRATTAGYLFPLAYFGKNSVPDYHRYFRETYFAGTHEAVAYDVLNRRADAGALKNTVFERLSEREPRVDKELTILDRSPPVPENGLAVRGDLDPALTQALKGCLLEMAGNPEGRRILERFGARRFIETTDADYDPVVSYARAIGLDVATYDYTND